MIRLMKAVLAVFMQNIKDMPEHVVHVFHQHCRHQQCHETGQRVATLPVAANKEAAVMVQKCLHRHVIYFIISSYIYIYIFTSSYLAR